MIIIINDLIIFPDPRWPEGRLRCCPWQFFEKDQQRFGRPGQASPEPVLPLHGRTGSNCIKPTIRDNFACFYVKLFNSLYNLKSKQKI